MKRPTPTAAPCTPQRQLTPAQRELVRWLAREAIRQRRARARAPRVESAA